MKPTTITIPYDLGGRIRAVRNVLIPKLNQDEFFERVCAIHEELWSESISLSGYKKWEQNRSTPNCYAIASIAKAAKCSIYDILPSEANSKTSRSKRLLPAGLFLDHHFIGFLLNVRNEKGLANLLDRVQVAESWQLPVGCKLSPSLEPIGEEEFETKLEMVQDHLANICPDFSRTWATINQAIEGELKKWRRRVTAREKRGRT